jgi:hypothetical protein
MNVLILALTHAVAVLAGAYGWPHVSTLWTSFSANRAVKTAKALIAKAEADAKALEAAKATVAKGA